MTPTVLYSNPVHVIVYHQTFAVTHTIINDAAQIEISRNNSLHITRQISRKCRLIADCMRTRRKRREQVHTVAEW